MKKRTIAVIAVLLIALTLFSLNRKISKYKNVRSGFVKSKSNDSFMNGDIIFQINTGGQGRAIQLATRSTYTHTGIIFKSDGEWKVYEAVEPVRCIPLSEFIKNGEASHYIIKRIKNRDSLMVEGRIALMKSYLEQQIGKDYDSYFSWSDSTLYCSELVWKSYHKTGLKLCELRKLKSYNLRNKIVKTALKEKYGTKIPLNEKVVSPQDIIESDLLETIN